MAIREFRLEDAEEVFVLWKKAGIFYDPWDKKENLAEKQKKESDLFLVYEENKKVVGVALSQYDGWGSYIHHLASADSYGKIGSALIKEMERRLKSKGAKTVFLFTNPKSKESAFVQNEGYKSWGISEGWEKKL